MAASSIAHFGTTLMEAPPPPGVPQAEASHSGDLGRTLRFLFYAGLRPLVANMYEGIGRQYIWSRGKPADLDYLEIDSFTSYTAEPRPETPDGGPRVGDVVFRLTHALPQGLYRAWRREHLVTPLLDETAEERFLEQRRQWMLLRGPQGQVFELGPTQPTRATNHTVHIWTDHRELEATAEDFCRHFDLREAGTVDFHGVGQALYLRRDTPGVTISLLTPEPGDHLAPRYSEDIFREAGYSHFRLGSRRKAEAEAASRQAFPPGSDVSYVFFRHAYLELVQIQPDDPACQPDARDWPVA